MNRDIAIREEGGWQVAPHLGGTVPAGTAPHSTVDLARLIRILNEWRWLIAGAALLGLLLAVLATLLTTPLYRAKVTLEVNPPHVEIMGEKGGTQDLSQVNNWDFVATQVGLLKSQALAQRVFEDLNLASNPGFARQSSDP